MRAQLFGWLWRLPQSGLRLPGYFYSQNIRFGCRTTKTLILRSLKKIQIGIAALTITVSSWEDASTPVTILKSVKLIVWADSRQNNWTVRVKWVQSLNFKLSTLMFYFELRKTALLVALAANLNASKQHQLRKLQLPQFLQPQPRQLGTQFLYWVLKILQTNPLL